MVEWIISCITTVSYSICVNGESFGYFKGGGGLRQGDPISPYIFTLVMEMMSLIVQDKVDRNKEFGYHFGCKQMKLTHVCFADDLLMFPCIKIEDKQAILECVPFKVEQLSVKLLLIASVLESIHVYWDSVLLLPKAVTEDINKLLKGFLWNQGELSRGKEKIAWKNIYRPKSQGGLGLKDLGVWNKAMIVKHLWNVITDKDSLWVKWINTVKLKGRSVWAVSEEINDSWAGILQSFITHRDLYNVRWNDSMVVKDIMDNDVCMWLEGWIAKYPSLVMNNRIDLRSDKVDMII
ncbi:RNA-directed DNA polymerase, eukaryota, reverse transcriptase zinc-binding domain protein [Tanacetum coccineum]